MSVVVAAAITILVVVIVGLTIRYFVIKRRRERGNKLQDGATSKQTGKLSSWGFDSVRSDSAPSHHDQTTSDDNLDSAVNIVASSGESYS